MSNRVSTKNPAVVEAVKTARQFGAGEEVRVEDLPLIEFLELRVEQAGEEVARCKEVHDAAYERLVNAVMAQTKARQELAKAKRSRK